MDLSVCLSLFHTLVSPGCHWRGALLLCNLGAIWVTAHCYQLFSALSVMYTCSVNTFRILITLADSARRAFGGCEWEHRLALGKFVLITQQKKSCSCHMWPSGQTHTSRQVCKHLHACSRGVFIDYAFKVYILQVRALTGNQTLWKATVRMLEAVMLMLLFKMLREVLNLQLSWLKACVEYDLHKAAL